VSAFLTSTRGRLTLLYVAVFGISVVLAVVGLSVYLAIDGQNDADTTLLQQAQLLASTVQERGGRVVFVGAGGDLPTVTARGIAVAAAVVTPQGVALQSNPQFLPPPLLVILAAQARERGQPIWLDTENGREEVLRVYAQPLALPQHPGAVLLVSRSVAELRATQERLTAVLILLALLVVLTGGALAYWIAGRALRPVRTIAGIARSLSEQDLHRRVEVAVPPDELGELVDTFNGMLARLEASFASLRRFTADASHELRAPLALMRSELDVALTRPRSAAAYRHVLGVVRGEVERLTRLADQLLLLARADAAALHPRMEGVDVADFLHETAARWSTVAAQRSVELDVAAPDAGAMQADPDLIRRALDNLIDNALRYAPASSRVRLSAERTDGGWRFEVADQGPGVPAEYRPRLFARFARADNARARDGGGAGLGLALGAAIARAHGGQITLVPRPGYGAVFQLSLPESSATR
jgi:two-component system, OmpR family, sensor kinase